MSTIYVFQEGEFIDVDSVFDAARTCNWVDTVIIIAEDEAEAREIAAAYDRGEIRPDNHMVGDETIVALRRGDER